MRRWALEMRTQCTMGITNEFTWKGDDYSSKAGALAQSPDVV